MEVNQTQVPGVRRRFTKGLTRQFKNFEIVA